MSIYDIKQFTWLLNKLCDKFENRKNEIPFFIELEETRLLKKVKIEAIRDIKNQMKELRDKKGPEKDKEKLE
jgi:hypothetical protein